MNPLKLAADLVVSAGVGTIVGNAIKATTPAHVTKGNKIMISIGGVVLSSMVGGKASEYAIEQIDLTVEQVKAIKKTYKEKQAAAAAKN